MNQGTYKQNNLIITRYKEKTINGAVNKSIKRSSIAENIIYNPTCAAKYEFSIFKILYDL